MYREIKPNPAVPSSLSVVPSYQTEQQQALAKAPLRPYRSKNTLKGALEELHAELPEPYCTNRLSRYQLLELATQYIQTLEEGLKNPQTPTHQLGLPEGNNDSLAPF